MDTIEARELKSEYANAEHLVFVINGEPLDLTLHARYPEEKYNGLVPTLLDWLTDPDERKVVWSRILPDNHHTSVAPVLMCPDDPDLWCTVIVAEVHRADDTILWRRLGRAAGGSEGLPASIGQEVEWFPGLSFVFSVNDYRDCIRAFEEQLNQEENTVT